MALFTLRFDCPLFSQEAEAHFEPVPDIFDMVFTRFNQSVAELLTTVAPHAGVILGDTDEDDD